MQNYGRLRETPVLRTRPCVEDAAPQNPTPTPLNGLAKEAGTREEKQLKETQTLPQRKPPIKKNCRVRPVWRGGRTEKDLRQKKHRKGIMARQTLVEMKGNTGANTREKSC